MVIASQSIAVLYNAVQSQSPREFHPIENRSSILLRFAGGGDGVPSSTLASRCSTG